MPQNAALILSPFNTGCPTSTYTVWGWKFWDPTGGLSLFSGLGKRNGEASTLRLGSTGAGGEQADLQGLEGDIRIKEAEIPCPLSGPPGTISSPGFHLPISSNDASLYASYDTTPLATFSPIILSSVPSSGVWAASLLRHWVLFLHDLSYGHKALRSPIRCSVLVLTWLVRVCVVGSGCLWPLTACSGSG